MSVCSLPVSSEHPLSASRPCPATSMHLMPQGFQSPTNLDLLMMRKKRAEALSNDKLPSKHCNMHNSSCLCRKQKTQQLNREEVDEEEGGQSRILARKRGHNTAEIVIPWIKSEILSIRGTAKIHRILTRLSSPVTWRKRVNSPV